jgi:8-hydroxy-5-deazaflavin:NADPH oxidoreductase
MKIAIIGSGVVGVALARRLGEAGHGVSFAVRDPSSPRARAAAEATRGAIPLTPVVAAVAAAEVVVLATQFGDAEAALAGAGPLTGKILIDATNPLKPDLSGFSIAGETSAAERVAAWAGGARVVKAFNTTGFNVMENPRFPAGAAAMFVCGDDASARNTVLGLARDIGFDAVDAGSLVEARLLEPLAMLWIKLAYARGLGRDIAFALLRR